MPRKKEKRRKSLKHGAIHLLDQFSEDDVNNWNEAYDRFKLYWVQIHYHLEGLRTLHLEEIIESLQKPASTSVKFNKWCRIVDFRYSDNPLSARGSIIIGGRFNMGNEIPSAVYKSNAVLYCAENYDTAYAERFGSTKKNNEHSLSGEEYSLRKAGSFLYVRLNGDIHNVFDLHKTSNLTSFVNIIKKFDVPTTLEELAKEININSQLLITKPSGLKEVLLLQSWREMITLYDIPSSSQVFGRLLLQAGYDGVLYPSTKGPKKCLAIFLENLNGSDSFIELADPGPNNIQHSRLDKNNWQDLQ